VPGREELAFGAIANGGVRVLEEQIIEAAGLSDWQIERVTRAERTELTRRQRLYQDGRPALEVRGKTVILVDDGMATGSSLRAGVLALRQMQPAAIVIAAPVAPAATGNRLRLEVDDIVCVEVPETFYGVGPFYLDFSQVSDEEVIELLDRASGPRFDHPHGHREATPGASA
jgi:putative phosphoribosyl transferase